MNKIKVDDADQCNGRDQEKLNAVVFVEPELKNSHICFIFMLIMRRQSALSRPSSYALREGDLFKGKSSTDNIKKIPT